VPESKIETHLERFCSVKPRRAATVVSSDTQESDMAQEKKRDLRKDMWERGPVEGWNGEGRGEAEQQARENIDPDNPRIVRPDSSVQAPGQTTSN
jgi:hypothetical protein